MAAVELWSPLLLVLVVVLALRKQTAHAAHSEDEEEGRGLGQAVNIVQKVSNYIILWLQKVSLGKRRFADLQSPIDWLVRAGLAVKITANPLSLGRHGIVNVPLYCAGRLSALVQGFMADPPAAKG